MRETTITEIYTCDRCGIKIDKIVNYGLFKSRITISFNQFEQVKEGWILSDEMIPLPEQEKISLGCLIGYKDVFKDVHLCAKCSKEFRNFMKNKNNCKHNKEVEE